MADQRISDSRDPIQTGILYLAGLDPDHAGQRNGAGYNATDGEFGHSLAEQIRAGRELSARQLHAAWKMLQKYHGQLDGIDVDIAALPEPEITSSTSTPTARPGATVQVRRNKETGTRTAVIKFPGSTPAKDELKRIFAGSWRFSGSPAYEWHVALTGQTATNLVSFCRRHSIAGTDELEIIAHRAATEREAAVTASRPATVDFHVDGLGGTLRPFQLAGVQYAVQHERTFIADQMGLGKTVEALATLQATNNYPAVIVCPASLKLNWKREAERWLPGHSISVINGGRADYSADLVIINYDVLSRHVKELMRQTFRALIADESHYAKERTSQRSKALKALATGRLPGKDGRRTPELETAPIPVRLLLTGTPVLNRPAELIHQLDVLGRLNDLGGWNTFTNRYCDAKRTRFGLDLSGAAHLDELNERLRAHCMVRRLKADVLTELPAKARATVPVQITNRLAYDRAAEDVIEWLRENVSDAAAAKATRAEQLVRIEALKNLAAEGKLTAVIEWVESFLESDQKLVLFAHHVDVQKTLLAKFPGASRLLGEDPTEIRQANVDRFQDDPTCRLIVCSLVAGGVGITLTAASNVAFVELGWNPGQMDQAEDRCHRIGQHDAVTAWYLLATGTIDEQIAALIDAKRSVVDAATDGGNTSGEGILSALVDQLTGDRSRCPTATPEPEASTEPSAPSLSEELDGHGR